MKELVSRSCVSRRSRRRSGRSADGGAAVSRAESSPGRFGAKRPAAASRPLRRGEEPRVRVERRPEADEDHFRVVRGERAAAVGASASRAPVREGEVVVGRDEKRLPVDDVDRLDRVEGEAEEVAVPADGRRIGDREEVDEERLPDVPVVRRRRGKVEEEDLLEPRRREVVAVVVAFDHQELPVVHRLQLADRDRPGGRRRQRPGRPGLPSNRRGLRGSPSGSASRGELRRKRPRRPAPRRRRRRSGGRGGRPRSRLPRGARRACRRRG